MDARELQEWMQYDRLSPIGSYRDDLRAVFIGWVVYSMNQPPKKEGGNPMPLEQFMDEYWPDWLSTPEEREERRQKRVQGKIKRFLGGG